MVIDTFFFRTTAMVPPSLKVVVILENNVPAVPPRKSRMDTISGIIDYTAIVAQSTVAGVSVTLFCAFCVVKFYLQIIMFAFLQR